MSKTDDKINVASIIYEGKHTTRFMQGYKKNLGNKINSHLKNHGIRNIMIAYNFFINVHMRAASSIGIFFSDKNLN